MNFMSDLFVYKSQGEPCNPDNWNKTKWALWRKPSQWYWQENTRNNPPPFPVLRWRYMEKRLFSFLWTFQRMLLNPLHRNFRVVWAPEERTQKTYRGGFLKSGEDIKRICTRIETFINWLAHKSPY